MGSGLALLSMIITRSLRLVSVSQKSSGSSESFSRIADEAEWRRWWLRLCDVSIIQLTGLYNSVVEQGAKYLMHLITPLTARGALWTLSTVISHLSSSSLMGQMMPLVIRWNWSYCTDRQLSMDLSMSPMAC